jgi:hypothetical protein
MENKYSKPLVRARRTDFISLTDNMIEKVLKNPESPVKEPIICYNGEATEANGFPSA